MSTTKTCQAIVGMEKSERHIIKLCGIPATRKGKASRRYYCDLHAKLWRFSEASTLIKPRKASKCE